MVSVRSLLLLTAATPVVSDCTSPAVEGLLKLFGLTTPKDLANTFLWGVEGECGTGSCPKVDVVAGCAKQSINDVNCEIKEVFSTSVKIGTDGICDAGCNDWPCVAGCSGIDVGICFGTDWILCKAGCLGIHSCVHKCEHALVDPCKKQLIENCKSKCDHAFNDCKSGCEKELTMQITADFKRLSGAITGAYVQSLDLDCTGNGITNAMNYSMSMSVHLDSLNLELRVRVEDAGIPATNDLSLDKIRMTVKVPVTGSLRCGAFRAKDDFIQASVGDVAVADVDLDVDLKLEKSLDTIASVVCAGLSFCKDAIKAAINQAIKKAIVAEVPGQLAKEIGSVLGGLLSTAHCPKLGSMIV